ncbi:MAG: hypothetical protein OXB98_15390 [Bryobacterales bacterium]|nr:hypothetical protein [Bryobacterales bacterium]
MLPKNPIKQDWKFSDRKESEEMKKSWLSEERIIEVPRQLEAGRKVSQLKRFKELE